MNQRLSVVMRTAGGGFIRFTLTVWVFSRSAESCFQGLGMYIVRGTPAAANVALNLVFRQSASSMTEQPYNSMRARLTSSLTSVPQL